MHTEKSNVKLIIIEAANTGQRVDNFLINQFKGVPKSRVYRAIRNGEVRINKKRVKADTRLQGGDELRLPPLYQEAQRTLIPSASLQRLLLDSILYEDDEIILINKPAGVAVHGGTQIPVGLIEALRYARSDLNYIELVHRLDRQTSGCLLLAKSLPVRRGLQELFVSRQIKKSYLLLVKGQWKEAAVKVNLALAKGHVESGERKVRIEENGKRAFTLFTPYRIGNEMSVVKAEIETGRMHQIRVHAASIGYPIVGDEKYGDSEFNSYVAKRLGKTLFLHSAALEFTLASGKKISICAVLPKEWISTGLLK